MKRTLIIFIALLTAQTGWDVSQAQTTTAPAAPASGATLTPPATGAVPPAGGVVPPAGGVVNPARPAQAPAIPGRTLTPPSTPTIPGQPINPNQGRVVIPPPRGIGTPPQGAVFGTNLIPPGRPFGGPLPPGRAFNPTNPPLGRPFSVTNLPGGFTNSGSSMIPGRPFGANPGPAFPGTNSFVATNISHVPVALSAQQRAAVNRLAARFSALQANQNSPAMRDQLQRELALLTQNQIPDQTGVSQLAADLANAFSTTQLSRGSQVLLARNIALLLSGEPMSQAQAQLLLGQTQSVLANSGFSPEAVQVIGTDLSALIAAIQQQAPTTDALPNAVGNPRSGAEESGAAAGSSGSGAGLGLPANGQRPIGIENRNRLGDPRSGAEESGAVRNGGSGSGARQGVPPSGARIPPRVGGSATNSSDIRSGAEESGAAAGTSTSQP